MAFPGVNCSILPTDFREVQAQWASSGTVSAFDFGSGIVTADAQFPLEVSGTSIECRPDALTFDYNVAFSYGPYMTGSTVSGALDRAYRAAHVEDVPGVGSGTIYLARENDAGTDWETDFPLFIYTGSFAKEIDLVFDQNGQPIIVMDRDFAIGDHTESIIWIYRFVDTQFRFTPIGTGSTPRVILDDPVNTEVSDIILFYRRGWTHETAVSGTSAMIFTTGSGVTGDISSSILNDTIELYLENYVWVADKATYPGDFMSFPNMNFPYGSIKPLTGSFNSPVKAVGIVLYGHTDYNKYLEVYDETGSYVTRSYFVPSRVSDAYNWDNEYRPSPSVDVKVLRAGPSQNIQSFVVGESDGGPLPDWVGYGGVFVLPYSGTEGGQNVDTYGQTYLFWRQQRDNYLIENSVPLTNEQFFFTLYSYTGSFTGTVGIDEPAQIDGVFYDATYISGALNLVGSYSGTIVSSSGTPPTFSGSLYGYATGTVSGMMAGMMSGTFVARQNSWVGEGSGSSSIVSVIEEPYKYELFLEDAVKLSDNRLAAYISRRNIDSSSADLGEYVVNKIESILYPYWEKEDGKLEHTVAYVTGTLNPILAYDAAPGEYFNWIVNTIPSGSHALYETVYLIEFQEDHFWNIYTIIPSGSHALYDVFVTASIYDKDAIATMSVHLDSNSNFEYGLVKRQQQFVYVEGLASWSFSSHSGSLENQI